MYLVMITLFTLCFVRLVAILPHFFPTLILSTCIKKYMSTYMMIWRKNEVYEWEDNVKYLTCNERVTLFHLIYLFETMNKTCNSLGSQIFFFFFLLVFNNTKAESCISITRILMQCCRLGAKWLESCMKKKIWRC